MARAGAVRYHPLAMISAGSSSRWVAALRCALATACAAAALVPCADFSAREVATHLGPHAETLVADAATGEGAHPCPEHAPETPPWLEEPCPCGCGGSAPPGSGSGRTGPALLVNASALPHAKESPPFLYLAADPRARVPGPPDPVPRSA